MWWAELAAGLLEGKQGSCVVAEWLCDAACASGQSRLTALDSSSTTSTPLVTML
jgi:hypothetical protein